MNDRDDTSPVLERQARVLADQVMNLASRIEPLAIENAELRGEIERIRRERDALKVNQEQLEADIRRIQSDALELRADLERWSSRHHKRSFIGRVRLALAKHIASRVRRSRTDASIDLDEVPGSEK